jgi:dihydrolipoamide dehydrogenase
MAIETQLVVLGSGPGGYSAAFRAADLGLNVVLVERFGTLGGVCLNVGCIPSKALLHMAKVLDEAEEVSAHGIDFGKPKIDVKKLVAYKEGVISKLTGGLAAMAGQRKVQVVQGEGRFVSSTQMTVTNAKGGVETITFENAIIAAGSQPVQLPFVPEDPRIFDSTGALELKKTKGHMLVLGGGIIGLEMATIYSALGSTISIVEMMDQIIPGADKDVVKPLHRRIEKRYENIYLQTKVTKVDAKKDGIYVTFEGAKAPKEPQKFDQVLVAVGRKPNGGLIDADKAGVNVDERGFIAVDNQQRTNVTNIYAIGDVVGQPMLAHKAVPQGRLAAEVIAGKKHFFDPACIAGVAYTDPEIAWVGKTEQQCKEEKIAYGKGVFPWAASGRALSIDRSEGMTKVLFDEKTNRLIGAAFAGPNAGELVSEAALAIEMGCDAEDISLTIHPHPTLAESFAMATEVFEGTVTDLYLPKKKSKR